VGCGLEDAASVDLHSLSDLETEAIMGYLDLLNLTVPPHSVDASLGVLGDLDL
jgi:hypothetical protein